MTVVYHLCAYDKTTERLVEEHPVPARLLAMVRTLIEPVRGDRDLVLPYELEISAAQMLADALGLTIDPMKMSYYFEGSGASDTGVGREAATTAR